MSGGLPEPARARTDAHADGSTFPPLETKGTRIAGLLNERSFSIMRG